MLQRYNQNIFGFYGHHMTKLLYYFHALMVVDIFFLLILYLFLENFKIFIIILHIHVYSNSKKSKNIIKVTLADHHKIY